MTSFNSGIVQTCVLGLAADAEVTRVTGEATAARTLAVGSADAKIIELKVKSMESGKLCCGPGRRSALAGDTAHRP